MLIPSISAASAEPTAQALGGRRVNAWSRSRSIGRTGWEAPPPGMGRAGCSPTAAATTGPARQPRPTSSQPAMRAKPTRRIAFSSVRMAGTLIQVGVSVGPGRLLLALVVDLDAVDLDTLHPRRLA